MLSNETEMQIVNLFLSIAEGERQVEICRKVLSDITEYDPYQVFRYLDKESKNSISDENIMVFLQEKGINCTLLEIKMMIMFYDENMDGQLSLCEFLKLIQSKTNPKNHNQYLVGKKIGFNVEFSLSGLFEKEINLARCLLCSLDDIKTRNDFNVHDIFVTLKTSYTITMDSIRNFMEKHNHINDNNDIVAIFNRLDFNCDGKIDLSELHRFFDFPNYNYESNNCNVCYNDKKNKLSNDQNEGGNEDNNMDEGRNKKCSKEKFKNVSGNSEFIEGITGKETKVNSGEISIRTNEGRSLTYRGRDRSSQINSLNNIININTTRNNRKNIFKNNFSLNNNSDDLENDDSGNYHYEFKYQLKPNEYSNESMSQNYCQSTKNRYHNDLGNNKYKNIFDKNRQPNTALDNYKNSNYNNNYNYNYNYNFGNISTYRPTSKLSKYNNIKKYNSSFSSPRIPQEDLGSIYNVNVNNNNPVKLRNDNLNKFREQDNRVNNFNLDSNQGINATYNLNNNQYSSSIKIDNQNMYNSYKMGNSNSQLGTPIGQNNYDNLENNRSSQYNLPINQNSYENIEVNNQYNPSFTQNKYSNTNNQINTTNQYNLPITQQVYNNMDNDKITYNLESSSNQQVPPPNIQAYQNNTYNINPLPSSNLSADPTNFRNDNYNISQNQLSYSLQPSSENNTVSRKILPFPNHVPCTKQFVPASEIPYNLLKPIPQPQPQIQNQNVPTLDYSPSRRMSPPNMLSIHVEAPPMEQIPYPQVRPVLSCAIEPRSENLPDKEPLYSKKDVRTTYFLRLPREGSGKIQGTKSQKEIARNAHYKNLSSSLELRFSPERRFAPGQNINKGGSEPNGEKKKKLNINSRDPKEQFLAYLELLSEIESKIDNFKEELSEREDFNLEDCYGLFTDSKKFLLDDDIVKGFDKMELKIKKSDAFLLRDRFDIDDEGVLNKECFFDMIAPYDPENRRILENRQSNKDKNNDGKIFCDETMTSLKSLLENLVEYEKKIRDAKLKMSIINNKDIAAKLFDEVDLAKNGSVNCEEFIKFLKKKKLYQTDEDSKVLFARFDKRKKQEFDQWALGKELTLAKQ